MWPPDLLEDLLTIPSVDVCLCATRMPVFEIRLSIPNQVAWMPQALHTLLPWSLTQPVL